MLNQALATQKNYLKV